MHVSLFKNGGPFMPSANPMPDGHAYLGRNPPWGEDGSRRSPTVSARIVLKPSFGNIDQMSAGEEIFDL
jgi:hypothetical protein